MRDEVRPTDLAKLLGLKQPSIYTLEKSGTVTRSESGGYDIWVNIPAYCESLRNRTQVGGTNAQQVKQRKTELECQKIEQNLNEQQEVLKQEAKDEILSKVVEGLEVIRRSYRSIKMPKDVKTKLLKSFDKAREKLEEI